MGRRTFIILIVVVALLALLAVAYFAITGGGGGDTPVTEGEVPVGDVGAGEEAPLVETVTPVPTSVPTDTVYVSLQTVPRGFQYPLTVEELLSGELVRQERRAVAEGESLNSNFIVEIEDIVGKYARNRIFQGETLTKDALASDPTLTGVENFGPSSLIPYGSVAAAIPMDRLSSVAYALDEGDHVDIMITFLFYKIDEEFQTYLQNAGVFFVQESLQAAESTGAAGDAAAGGEGAATQDIFVISPYGRFEQLPTGDLAHISPSEPQRPIPISMILQNAKVIQVGEWQPQAFAQLPTPVPPPAEGEATPSPTPQVTPIPNPPEVLVLALSPQQQLLVKYAVESFANFDFALRGANDGQLYSIDNVDLDFILQRFGIDVPLNFGYSVDPAPDATATPAAVGQGE